jgi:hypothetical protein
LFFNESFVQRSPLFGRAIRLSHHISRSASDNAAMSRGRLRGNCSKPSGTVIGLGATIRAQTSASLWLSLERRLRGLNDDEIID